MKRMHVNISVSNLQESVDFYSALFAAEPTVLKQDYAKWMLEDPRVNFALSEHGTQIGIEHLGIQAETPEEMLEIYSRLEKAKGIIQEEGTTTCCYAQSEKSWIKDPQGVEWETFYTFGEATKYSGEIQETACCAATCCPPASA
ncbi:ArsI/CadI family heavy metal resistance metalloenzyme [Rufibacter latericius]|uniref:Glyoxalase/bleomycin resistance/dioxygenase family protein n=1 Tax=Rufibacter latericius TaxID=2487040 RepID=A0A3M9MJN8_9BACT|nr:ArsI/CadI family heavy metal resistance metalloenzyme [Rufibacter latericius]RNI25769.1 glyoxalase/bleomycin resistance/dioxygenase family protein [Rufibacter latericius]